MTNTLHIDLSTGITLDRLIGALMDLGVKPSTIEWELGKVDIGDFHLHVQPVTRKEQAGVQFELHLDEEHGAAHTHGHHHKDKDEDEDEETEEEGHREDSDNKDDLEDEDEDDTDAVGTTFGEVRYLIEHSELSDPIKKQTLATYRILAETSARIHEMSTDTSPLGESADPDQVAQLVAVCACLEALKIQSLVGSTLVFETDVHGPLVEELASRIPNEHPKSGQQPISELALAFIRSSIKEFKEVPAKHERAGVGFNTRKTHPPMRIYLY